MTVLILSGMGFTNSKHYFLLKNPNYPEWQLIDLFLVDEVFSWTILFINCHHKLSVGFRSGLCCWPCHWFICLSWRKALLAFALWENSLSSWKMTSSPNQFSPVEMRKLSRISMNNSALIVEVMTVISFGSLNDRQPRVINDLFSSGSHFYTFHLTETRQKLHHHLGQCRFFIHHRISLPSVYTPCWFLWPTLTLSYPISVEVLVFIWLSKM